MYFPYFRGKQNELILLRENAELIAESKVIPIVEPVKSNLNPIKKSLDALVENSAEFILIANPHHGDFVDDGDGLIEKILSDKSGAHEGLILGYIFDGDTELDDFVTFANKYSGNRIAIIHYGYSSGRRLAEVLSDFENVEYHIFIEEYARRRYRRSFKKDGVKRVLIRDGFVKRSNREHPSVERFSELHIMFDEEGMEGFGDFLISGDEYSESGGPAYAVAIHLTYIDEDEEDDMFVKHYVSDRNSTPADPGGKFLEALDKLLLDVDRDTDIYSSKAVDEFRSLHKKQHFPGLGMVKKLSMQHHVELIADFLCEA